MTSFSDNPGSSEKKLSFSQQSAPIEIPSDIYEQEKEIESILRNLAQFGETSEFHDSQNWSEGIQSQEGLAWIFLAVLGFFCTLAFCLLCIR
jgi:hypothetical protein